MLYNFLGKNGIFTVDWLVLTLGKLIHIIIIIVGVSKNFMIFVQLLKDQAFVWKIFH